VDTVLLFGQLPGISEKLARRIVEDLGVRTLEQLELAAHDGSLKRVKGFGGQRVREVKEALAGRLSRYGPKGSMEQQPERTTSVEATVQKPLGRRS
jgi:ERCC4-type nuclease